LLIFTSFYDRIIDDFSRFCQLLMDLWRRSHFLFCYGKGGDRRNVFNLKILLTELLYFVRKYCLHGNVGFAIVNLTDKSSDRSNLEQSS
jgi:hypothetical protein